MERYILAPSTLKIVLNPSFLYYKLSTKYSWHKNITNFALSELQASTVWSKHYDSVQIKPTTPEEQHTNTFYLSSGSFSSEHNLNQQQKSH